jgi:glycosyltransferase involved in cell wall biosynthesis
MRILLYDDTPSYFCHGGKQVLAERLHDSLIALNQDVDYAHWWDPSQKCNLIHLLSPSPGMISMAHAAGAKVVLTHIVDRLTNLPRRQFNSRRAASYFIRTFLPASIVSRFSWSSFREVDAAIYLHRYDAEAAISVYGMPREKTYIIPHGFDTGLVTPSRLLNQGAASYLVSVASIVPRKNSVLLARAAKRSGVPVVFLGKPFNEQDPYYRQFLELVDGTSVIYPGYVSESDKQQVLARAAGFVLLSIAESGCIAVYEAAAAGLPMLLTDAPWAHAYGTSPAIRYTDVADESLVSHRLKSFFTEAERSENSTFPLISWEEVAKRHLTVYRKVLGIDG